MPPLLFLALGLATTSLAQTSPSSSEFARIVFEIPRAYNFSQHSAPVESTLWSVTDIYALSAETGSLSAQPRRVIEGQSPPISPDGSRIVYCSRNSNLIDELRIANIDGSNPRTLVHLRGGACFPTWSPDGRTIAFTGSTSSGPGQDPQIYFIHPDGSELTAIASGDGPALWSPDGKRLLFLLAMPRAYRSGNRYSVYIANADGSHPQCLPHFIVRFPQLAWLPDGSGFAYVGRDERQHQVIKSVHLDDQLTPSPSTTFVDIRALAGIHDLKSYKDVDISHPRFSPDGTELIAEVRQSYNPYNFDPESYLVLIHLNTGNATLLSAGQNASIQWRPRAQAQLIPSPSPHL